MDHTSILWIDQLHVGEIPRHASPPRDHDASSGSDLMPLKILNRALMFLDRRLCLESSQIPALSRLRIFLPRIQPIFTGLELPDHAVSISNFITWALVRHLHALGLR
jgi:hypothetical protein